MGAVGKKQDGLLLGGGCGGQDGVVVGGVQAEDHFGAGRFFDPGAFGANGDTAIVAHAEGGAHAPDVGPPRIPG